MFLSLKQHNHTYPWKHPLQTLLPFPSCFHNRREHAKHAISSSMTPSLFSWRILLIEHNNKTTVNWNNTTQYCTFLSLPEEEMRDGYEVSVKGKQTSLWDFRTIRYIIPSFIYHNTWLREIASRNTRKNHMSCMTSKSLWQEEGRCRCSRSWVSSRVAESASSLNSLGDKMLFVQIA